MAGLGRTWLGYSNGFAVDGAYNSLPAGQGFFKVELNGCNEVVALTFEGRMFFLLVELAVDQANEYSCGHTSVTIR